jgi:PAS domain S-box-containing protein/putative nucleotidyltransferase with HDIG domain
MPRDTGSATAPAPQLAAMPETKHVEQTLDTATEWFHALVKNASDAVALLDEKGTILYQSPSSEKILGQRPEQLEGTSFPELIHLDDMQGWLSLMESVMANPGKIVTRGFRVKHEDGSWRTVEATSQNLLDDPMIGGIVANYHDVSDNIKAQQKLEKSIDGTIQAITRIVEGRDVHTANHQRRVAQLACAIAGEMGFTLEQIHVVRIAGLLHDIGMLSLPQDILNKPGKVTDVEFELIRTHCRTGHDILKPIEFPWPIADIVIQHHERMNGSGYPSGIRENALLNEARILGVADVVEAMSSYRPYRPPLGMDKALGQISRDSGVLYDPIVADACLRLFTNKGFEFED